MSKKKDEEKTNVMRLLDKENLPYTGHSYENVVSGLEVARVIGAEPKFVYKTLVTQGKSRGNYVFMIPVDKELDLRKAAKAAGEKSIEMIPSKKLLPLTGYIHGGCSPLGMKKLFPTFIEKEADNVGKIYFSGGKIGHQVQMNLEDLRKIIEITSADLVE